MLLASRTIGVSLNGVPFFNQYGTNQPLTNEINSFDQYLGHPQQTGQYHYHQEPAYLTTQNGKSAFLGFLLDGFLYMTSRKWQYPMLIWILITDIRM
jgi:hypothetical protein